MWRTASKGLALLGILIAANAVGAEKIPIEAFAASPEISDATISPDGHYLALISTAAGHHVLVVKDRGSGADSSFKSVLSDKLDGPQLRWCRFVNASRLVCGYRGVQRDVSRIYTWSRLVAVDATGENLKVLLQSNDAATGQFQDQIVDWHPGKPDDIWVQSEEVDAGVLRAEHAGATVVGQRTSGGYPAVFELNTVTGVSQIIEHARPPIWKFFSDGRGHLRFAWGLEQKTYRFYVRADDKSGWKSLLKYEAFSSQAAHVLRPIAIDPDNPNRAYALGNLDGREALWRVDLSDQEAPSVVFSHPSVDVGRAVFAKDGHLLGVYYDTELPFMRYTDSQAERVADTVRAALPGQLIGIIAYTADRKTYLIHASSDVNPGTYYLDEIEKGALQVIGKVSSRIVADELPHMRNVTYPAKDGTSIPAYLTVPLGVRPENLPLIVMPHGGPISRDRWEYFFLRDFLANRGYAVLQMNFRGSSGYGDAWFHAAHQDWGGLTYSDIVDGTAWAIKQGIADPKRVCVVGWSFGGYAALLSATRDSALYRCAVSIAGVSDLSLLLDQTSKFMGSEVSKAQIGTDKEKLAAASPRRHAEAVTIPILMVHGDKDPQVNLIESEEMAHALKRANKPYELLVFKDADHQIERETDRAAMLTAIEKFLLTNLGPGANPTQ